jgi:hypothetical protein
MAVSSPWMTTDHSTIVDSERPEEHLLLADNVHEEGVGA